MSDPMTFIVVAGSADVTAENVSDLVKDFLLLDTDDEKEFAFYLPADEALTTKAVIHTGAFLKEIDGGFLAVRNTSRPGLKGKQLARKADETLDAADTDGVMQALIEVLTDARDEGNEVYLFLAWGEGEEAPDEATDTLAALAVEAGIPVKDLTGGLDDIPFEEEGEEPESAEDVEEPTEEPRREKPVKELTETEQELTADEAQADAPGMIPGEPELSEAQMDLITVMAFVAQHLDFQDRMNAAANMQDLRRRPLTQAVRYHLHKLMDEAAEEDNKAAMEKDLKEAFFGSSKPAEPVQETLPEAEEEKPRARRGKARDTASDVVKVLINEKDKTARLSPGRGRPKKGEEPHEMTRAEFDELIASGEYTPF